MSSHVPISYLQLRDRAETPRAFFLPHRTEDKSQSRAFLYLISMIFHIVSVTGVPSRIIPPVLLTFRYQSFLGVFSDGGKFSEPRVSGCERQSELPMSPIDALAHTLLVISNITVSECPQTSQAVVLWHAAFESRRSERGRQLKRNKFIKEKIKGHEEIDAPLSRPPWLVLHVLWVKIHSARVNLVRSLDLRDWVSRNEERISSRF